MPDMLRRFFERSDQAKILCLERRIVNCAKARRLAEQAYLKARDTDEAERFLNLLGAAEERLDQAADQLLEMEAK